MWKVILLISVANTSTPYIPPVSMVMESNRSFDTIEECISNRRDIMDAKGVYLSMTFPGTRFRVESHCVNTQYRICEQIENNSDRARNLCSRILGRRT